MRKKELIASLLVIATSGFPFFLDNHKILYPATLLILFFVALYGNCFSKENIGKLFLTISLILLLFLLQGVKFNYINLNLFSSFFLFLIRVIIGFLAFIIIKDNFLLYFIKIIKFFSIISLIFYLLITFFPQVEYILIDIGNNYFSLPIKGDVSYAPSVFLFSTNIHDPTIPFSIRNPGPFWEPGTFAGFLNLAIIANSFNGVKIFDKRNLIFIIALITTFSTGGYILFFFITAALSIITGEKKFILIKTLISFLLIFAFYYVYNNVFFLKEKVEIQYNMAEEGTDYGRFASVKKDLKDIYEFPLLGRGRLSQMRFDKTYSYFVLENHRVSGITDFYVKFGVLFSTFILYYILIGFRRFRFIYKQNDYLLSYVFFIGLLTFCFYEPIMQLPIIFFFFFQGILPYKLNSCNY